MDIVIRRQLLSKAVSNNELRGWKRRTLVGNRKEAVLLLPLVAHVNRDFAKDIQ